MDKLAPGRGKRVLRAVAYGELSQPRTQRKPRYRSPLGDSVVLGLAEPDDHLSTTPAGPALAPTPAARCLGRLDCRTVAVCYLHTDGDSRAICSSTFPEVVGYLQSRVAWSSAAPAPPDPLAEVRLSDADAASTDAFAEERLDPTRSKLDAESGIQRTLGAHRPTCSKSESSARRIWDSTACTRFTLSASTPSSTLPCSALQEKFALVTNRKR